MTTIHPTALVDPAAELGHGVSVGPFSVIEKNVIIGDGTTIGSHVLIASGTRLGRDCRVHHGAVLGTVPQDLKFGNEETTLEIGDRTVIREYATLNRGTKEHWKTVVGSDCLLMAYIHVAHDCTVGNHVIMANAANLAGHVTVEDWATLGGLLAVHQFVRIGCHAFVGAGCKAMKDVPPYVLAMAEPLQFAGLNSVGLRRRGFSQETMALLKRAYRLLYRSNLNVSQALARIREELPQTEEIQHVVRFIEGSRRGII
ncbi:MAG: acyl-ACP--UDP-N-acetylglucosamine O-acyltransferase [candidate division KSB1 bacterium]|nr:acyl-ACP--UDP-N-acetylglucosamine O-acyltransferase [candidate division KSB1 bacterium]MDZ7380046.1 acyl-ACP--UDP-N-acetylglucosamine O-acyltransferase [candidate division KSB1 bacterium]MDZ7386768.1 acyl-ACP--UDP-N-acetylglucosamine O-acyltransferase [candidate division KSB1 bacterium]MDZ7392583.1 acyl-ACP--UDP-N-acetylglucosamine O-acyltransferase [candidate division KSB1 bacterium]MDZ7413618.1 acyl-ACP--UDP-N-acetylglucosamine O-acyltransferase [candidate division KSB1 bacterium]